MRWLIWLYTVGRFCYFRSEQGCSAVVTRRCSRERTWLWLGCGCEAVVRLADAFESESGCGSYRCGAESCDSQMISRARVAVARKSLYLLTYLLTHSFIDLLLAVVYDALFTVVLSQLCSYPTHSLRFRCILTYSFMDLLLAVVYDVRMQDDTYCGSAGMLSAVVSVDCGAAITAMDNHCVHAWDCESGRCILTIRVQQSVRRVRRRQAFDSAVLGGGYSR